MDDGFGRFAGGDGLVADLPVRQIGIPAIGQLAGEGALELVRRGRDALRHRRRASASHAFSALAPRLHGFAEDFERFVGNEEGRFLRPVEILLGGGNFVRSERRTVDAEGAFLLRRAKSDDRLAQG